MTELEAGSGGPPTLLRVRGLGKRFGPSAALHGVDLEVKERDVLALVGPSGSGKTVLCGIVAGLSRYDDGSLVFRDHAINLRSRRDGVRIGIALVPQQVVLIPDLTVYENVIVPAPSRAAPQDAVTLRKRVETVLAALGSGDPLPLDTLARRLTPPETRRVALARALVARAKLYVFDEPFAALAPRECEALIGILSRLRMSGCGVIVAARHLDDVLPFADRITVLSEGRSVYAGSGREPADVSHLRRLAGLRRERPATAAQPGPPVLVLDRVAAAPTLHDASVAVAAGETVALYGLQDAGCTALLEAIGGRRPRTGGTIMLGARLLPGGSPRAARRAGLAFAGRADPLPLPRATARANLDLLAATRDGDAWPRAAIWHSLKLAGSVLDEPVEAQPIGIRRRIALAAALLVGWDVVLLDEPTAGLSPSERSAVHATLRVAADQGRAIVLATPDREEVLATADRCLLLRAGRVAGDLPCRLLDGEALRLLAASPEAFARSTAVLSELTRENGGAAFWALRREGHVVCLDAAIADARADPGLSAAAATAIEATRIATALTRTGPTEFVVEPDGTRATMLVPIRTRRGSPLGWIGLTLGPGDRPPPAAAVAFRVETLTGSM